MVSAFVVFCSYDWLLAYVSLKEKKMFICCFGPFLLG